MYRMETEAVARSDAVQEKVCLVATLNLFYSFQRNLLKLILD